MTAGKSGSTQTAHPQAHEVEDGGLSCKAALAREYANGNELLQLLRHAPERSDVFTTTKQVQEWRQRVYRLLRNHPATAQRADEFAVETIKPAGPDASFLSRAVTRAYGPQWELERRLRTLAAITVDGPAGA